MILKNKILSETRFNRLRAQCYTCQTNYELSNMAFGFRFAYRICVGIVVTAMATQSLELFSAMLIIAFLGTTLLNHPLTTSTILHLVIDG